MLGLGLYADFTATKISIPLGTVNPKMVLTERTATSGCEAKQATQARPYDTMVSRMREHPLVMNQVSDISAKAKLIVQLSA
jgi:hypothetical protein